MGRKWECKTTQQNRILETVTVHLRYAEIKIKLLFSRSLMAEIVYNMYACAGYYCHVYIQSTAPQTVEHQCQYFYTKIPPSHNVTGYMNQLAKEKSTLRYCI